MADLFATDGTLVVSQEPANDHSLPPHFQDDMYSPASGVDQFVREDGPSIMSDIFGEEQCDQILFTMPGDGERIGAELLGPDARAELLGPDAREQFLGSDSMVTNPEESPTSICTDTYLCLTDDAIEPSPSITPQDGAKSRKKPENKKKGEPAAKPKKNPGKGKAKTVAPKASSKSNCQKAQTKPSVKTEAGKAQKPVAKNKRATPPKSLKRKAEEPEPVPLSISDAELLLLKPKKMRKKAKFDKPNPSRFCHVCSRTPKNVRLLVCSKISDGICRKVVCERCFVDYGYGDFEDSMESGTWLCPHCQHKCPERAQCRTYSRINDKLRVTRLKQPKTCRKQKKEDGSDNLSQEACKQIPCVGVDSTPDLSYGSAPPGAQECASIMGQSLTGSGYTTGPVAPGQLVADSSEGMGTAISPLLVSYEAPDVLNSSPFSQIDVAVPLHDPLGQEVMAPGVQEVQHNEAAVDTNAISLWDF